MLMDMFEGTINSIPTALASSITAQDTTITLVDGGVLPPGPNICTIGDSNDAETVQYSIKTGNTLLQVIRGFQGTAKAWNVDTVVARNFTEYDYRALKHNLETISIDMQGTLESGTITTVNGMITGVSKPSGDITMSRDNHGYMETMHAYGKTINIQRDRSNRITGWQVN